MNKPSQVAAVSIEKATKIAQDLYANGKLDQCVALIDRILVKSPKNAMALHLLGIIRFGQGATEIGIGHVSAALKLFPGHTLFAVNLTEMLRKSGDLVAAERVGRHAVKVDGGNATAHSNLGIVLYDLQKFDEAEACHHRALALNPGIAGSLNNLGSIARERRNMDEAERYYRSAIDAAPEAYESANNLASILIEAERLSEAQTLLVTVLKARPEYAEAHCNMGRILLSSADLDHAELAFRRAIKLNPKGHAGFIGLSQTMYEKHQGGLALEAARSAYQLAPDDTSALHQLGLCEADGGNTERAIALYDRAVAHNPSFTPSLLALGHLRMETGDMDGAEQFFQSALGNGADRLSSLMALSRLKKMTAEDPIVLELLSESDKILNSTPKKQVAYHYAMGKVFEDIKDYDAAFANFELGAKLKRMTIEYDAMITDHRIDQIIEAFSPDRLVEMRKAGIVTAQPIFVLGMPRSGTTLTESILARHSKVFAAGELPDLMGIFPSPAGHPVMGGISSMSNLDMTRCIEMYARQLDVRSPGMHRITDKMPANFSMIGIIHALLPNAKIIHVSRDPLDTCLSCFTRLFERSQLHSYDQVELGKYYLGYRRLMAHWSNVLPKDAFMELKYEDLVGDIEAQSRRMLDFCGLKWEDGCLEFHKDARRVRTASVSQVRQPVYSSSVEKWRNYESHLAPLMATIGDCKHSL